MPREYGRNERIGDQIRRDLSELDRLKLVLGLVYLDGKFYYHAWNEAFVGEWIAVDPTFGQLPADASHVKFLEGNLDKSSEILRLVGRIELDVVEAS